MNNFKPFQNETQSTTVGPSEGITFENKGEEINMYGDLTINQHTDPKEIEEIISLLNHIKNSLKKN